MTEVESIDLITHPLSGDVGLTLKMDRSALDRIATLPVVVTSWNFVHNIYTGAKKNHPSVTPLLETAEKITSSALSLALVTSKTVVDKLAPSVNSYANSGLDKLENRLPIITKEPVEIYEETKEKASSFINSRLYNVLTSAEDYVDSYLPRENYDEATDDEGDDEYSNSSISSGCDSEDNWNARQHVGDILHKVKQRTFNKAAGKWEDFRSNGIKVLRNPQSATGLIQYAQETVTTTSSEIVSFAIDKFVWLLFTTIDALQYALDTVNKLMQYTVVVRLNTIHKKFEEISGVTLNFIHRYPKLHYLFERVKHAKEVASDKLVTYAKNTTLLEMLTAISDYSRSTIKFIQENLIRLWKRIIDHPYANELVSKANLRRRSSAKDKED